MKLSIQRALVALITFSIGLAAVTFWYGYYQRAASKLRHVSAATRSEIPRAEITIAQAQAETNSESETKTDARQSKYLRAIEFVPYDEFFSLSPNKIENTAAKTINIDLGLGDNVLNQLIVLRTPDTIKREFKVEQQFETSFAVSDEGPHIDLIDWKHYRSEWRELKKVGEESFLTRKISESESSRFPPVSKKEIYKAVFKAGGRRWADETRSCKTLNSGPCYVSVSTISFRIKVKEAGRWKVINLINFMVPMGC